MPIVSAICPSCSAPLEVDNKTEAGVCKFCGNAFITEKAINSFNINMRSKPITLLSAIMSLWRLCLSVKRY